MPGSPSTARKVPSATAMMPRIPAAWRSPCEMDYALHGEHDERQAAGILGIIAVALGTFLAVLGLPGIIGGWALFSGARGAATRFGARVPSSPQHSVRHGSRHLHDLGNCYPCLSAKPPQQINQWPDQCAAGHAGIASRLTVATLGTTPHWVIFAAYKIL